MLLMIQRKDDTSTHIERMNKILELAKETTDKIDINKFIRSFYRRKS